MKINLVVFFTLCTLCFQKQAFGYIDPGTGSMVIQALLALFATVSVSVGIFWKNIRSFFSRIFQRDKND